jgi:hypothetical protein
MKLAGDNAGNQLPGTLASPRTGLTPAGCPEIIARLHHKLLSCGARTAGRTAYAEHLVDKIGNCVTAGQRGDREVSPRVLHSLRSLSIGQRARRGELYGWMSRQLRQLGLVLRVRGVQSMVDLPAVMLRYRRRPARRSRSVIASTGR